MVLSFTCYVLVLGVRLLKLGHWIFSRFAGSRRAGRDIGYWILVYWF